MSRFMVNGIHDIVILNDVVIYSYCDIMYLWNKILTIKRLIFISLEKSYWVEIIITFVRNRHIEHAKVEASDLGVSKWL
jgi:hypothetical protein